MLPGTQIGTLAANVQEALVMVFSQKVETTQCPLTDSSTNKCGIYGQYIPAIVLKVSYFACLNDIQLIPEGRSLGLVNIYR